MRWLAEGLRSALVAIRTNLMRTVLTTLGITIGVASVIVMVAVSEGARKDVEARIASLGSNVLQLRPGSSRVRGRSVGADSKLPFSEREMNEIRTRVGGVSAISGHLRRAGTVVAQDANWLTNIDGVHSSYLDVRDWQLDGGRNFTDSEYVGSAKVALIGTTVAKEVFGGANPIGERVRIANLPFEIIGVLTAKGADTSGRDQDDVVLVPLSTVRSRMMKKHKLVPDQVGYGMVKVESDEMIPQVREEIEVVLRNMRTAKPEAGDSFHIRDLTEYVRAKTATQETLGLLLAATATISLIVGGIGIMNIMLVSVTERTREIGLRMAIGARQRDIRAQFLLEAVVLCLVGGLIGSAIGVGSSLGIASRADWPVLIQPQVILLALSAAALTGILFGFLPAQRAAALNPIEALRSE